MRNLRNSPSLADLVELLGVRRTFDTCMELGGQRYYVPTGDRGPCGGHLSAFFTAGELKSISDVWGGTYVKFPIARTFCVQFLHHAEGKSYKEIARLVRITENGVGVALSTPIPPSIATFLCEMRRQQLSTPELPAADGSGEQLTAVGTAAPGPSTGAAVVLSDGSGAAASKTSG